MEKLKNFCCNHLWILIFPLSFFGMKALLVPGFYGASDDLHIAWLYELDKVIKLGQFPPRFVPDLSFGFGYPLFNFVFPLPFYIGEIFHLFGLNLVDSIKTIFLLSLPLSGILMHQFLRQFTSSWLSLAGAVVYMYTPYRSTDIYVRGAIGEIVAFIFLPLLALSVVRLSEEKDKSGNFLNIRWIGIGALSIAALILTHNITAYMFLPFILGLIFLQNLFSSKKNIIYNLIQSGLMILLALLISSYFWFPALTENKLVKYDTVFNYVDHYPTIRQLIIPYWGYGASVPGSFDGMSFFLGTINILLFVIGLLLAIVFWKQFAKNQKIILTWAGISFLIAVAMMNYRAIFIWQRIPFIPFFQFPWRFLIITTFMIPIFVIIFEKIKFQKMIALGIIALSIITTADNFYPHDNLGREDNYYINRYIPVPLASADYTMLNEEYLRLPLTTTMRPDKNYPRVFPQTDQIKKIEEINSLNATINTDSREEFTLNYNKYYFPGWHATIDGQNVEISAGYPFGQIQLKVPSGKHVVKISYSETNLKIFFDIVSAIGFVVAILCCIKPGLFKKRGII